MPEPVVVDASAVLDVLAGTTHAAGVSRRLHGTVWHAPAHLDAEVLSALGRLVRAGRLAEGDVHARLALLASMPVQRELLPALLPGAWARRADVRLEDALYVELADRLGTPLITTDARLARVSPLVELVVA